ncbi:MAG: hypothetical protein A3I77_03765 [Gammaproteobacteria bacterium RIFCSPLOWO2_02_FULL_42_14]|nr:MAG: hypothetical protein A2624_04145 [Gammaproteobacteria bacterium RIFCSPHIGHO2_01_FULL_42_8]OGT51375.1 MAG: hypothetical protein A3E54_04835 [Gammaproteobacteria bacterium RIFCSPHIGHO2_12_FULL_41_25]OGT62077.1 MAG: hypothetical protein A3I77_03765 [Gammaproteobacteria bacterium RIFCSPLOWO2_02_FULL_42_14]OGT85749.1 MAG: hypothetical protein A3G86_03460 [Gammaproteobacteria bacterium RIFCSPLOWO2_12_FULL_42_18]
MPFKKISTKNTAKFSGLKVLYVSPCFPAYSTSKRFQYIWDPISASTALGVDPVVLVTPSWRPKFAAIFHPDFIIEKIDETQFPVTLKICRYFSIPRHYFRSVSNFFYLIRVVPIIKKLIKMYGVELIHAHGEIAGMAAVSAGKQLNIPAVVTIHGVDTCKRMRKGVAGKQFKRALSQANKVIYVGESLQYLFSQVMEQDFNASIVHNGFKVPTVKFDRSCRKQGDTTGIISVSNLHEGKGVDITLRALAELKKLGIENWRYKIIGDGYQRKYLEKIAAEFSLENQIEFIGDCMHDEVYAYLRQSDIFCLPSYREAFGIAYVEAMAHGLLTIGVKDQGPQAFIEHGKTGLLAEPKDVNSLVEMLRYSIINVEKMKEIADAGQQHVLKYFTWEKHAEKLLSLYKEICGESQ